MSEAVAPGLRGPNATTSGPATPPPWPNGNGRPEPEA